LHFGGRYCDWAAPVPPEKPLLPPAIVPAVPATIAPKVSSATSRLSRGVVRLDVEGRLEVDGFTLAITLVLTLSSSNALNRGFPSRKRRTTSSSSLPH
jgi:hypothetical protein